MSYVGQTPEECCVISIVYSQNVDFFRLHFNLISDKEKFFSTKNGRIVMKYAMKWFRKGNPDFLIIVSDHYHG